jgi:hypothetical protein
MKTSVVVLLTTLLSAVIVPAVHGIETDRDAMDRGSVPKATGSVSAARVRQNDPAAIAKLIEDINVAVRSNKQRMLSIIVINTDVAASQLEREKAETGMTFGDLYVAHSLALATNKKFKAIMAFHKSGKSWADIARSHGVSLRGSSELIKEMQKQ